MRELLSKCIKSKFIKRLKIFIHDKFSFKNFISRFTNSIIIRTASMVRGRLMPKVLISSSITLFLNSHPLSVWKMRISDRFTLLLRNTSYTSSAFFFVPAEYPIISLLNRSINMHTSHHLSFTLTYVRSPITTSRYSLSLNFLLASFAIFSSFHVLL